MPITLLDGILLVIMLVSALLAMIRGFVREVLSIVSWIAAAAAAFALYKFLLPYASQYISNKMVATGASAAIIFLVTLVIISYITMRISDFILDSRIGALDRTLGFVFGGLRGLLLVAVALMFFNWFVHEDQQPTWVVQAKSRPVLMAIGQRLVAMLPEDPEQAILQKLEQTKAMSKDKSGTNADIKLENQGYSASQRRGIDQLSSGGN